MGVNVGVVIFAVLSVVFLVVVCVLVWKLLKLKGKEGFICEFVEDYMLRSKFTPGYMEGRDKLGYASYKRQSTTGPICTASHWNYTMRERDSS